MQWDDYQSGDQKKWNEKNPSHIIQKTKSTSVFLKSYLGNCQQDEWGLQQMAESNYQPTLWRDQLLSDLW